MLLVKLVLCLLISTGLSQSYRLSRDVIPKHYSIKIRPDFEKEKFFGEVLIYINTYTNTEKIILHSSQLNITETYINQKEGIIETESDDRLSVRYAERKIQPGEHTIKFKYEGQLKEGKFGFIKAPYKYPYQNETYIYVTDLEPTNARKVFPCFDEPFFKAKFNIRLVSPDKKYIGISNMPEIGRFDTPQGTVYNFETSVLMSSYLVSFAFTHYPKYQEIMVQDNKEVPITIYTLNASEINNKNPMKYAITALKFYTEYTDIPYPLPKLDMIEYERTESAATENWGLITFRKGLLTSKLGLYYPSQIELVVYHELSHFWFGNLVTNDWWNDLWLQEGFASYMSYKLSAQQNGISQVKNMKDFQIGRYLDTELRVPATPIVSYITKPEYIMKQFSHIVYDKAANLLLVLETIIGEDKFKEIIRKYLKKYAYKTVTTNDFLATVEEVVPKIEIRSFLESYLYQERFPLISVEEDGNGTFILRQEVAGGTETGSESVRKAKWTIPITYTTDTVNISKILWFDKDMDTLEIKEPNAKWFLLNTNGLEMYKTQLSDALWERIIENFQEQRATTLNELRIRILEVLRDIPPEMLSNDVPVFIIDWDTAQLFSDIDVETSEQIVSDALYLFKFTKSNCDTLIRLMEKNNRRDKWVCFSQFAFSLKYNLNCYTFTEELKIFQDFLQKRFEQTNYPKKVSDAVECVENNDAADDIDQPSMKKCAKWIEENLGGTEDNTVKQIV